MIMNIGALSSQHPSTSLKASSFTRSSQIPLDGWGACRPKWKWLDKQTYLFLRASFLLRKDSSAANKALSIRKWTEASKLREIYSEQVWWLIVYYSTVTVLNVKHSGNVLFSEHYCKEYHYSKATTGKQMERNCLITTETIVTKATSRHAIPHN